MSRELMQQALYALEAVYMPHHPTVNALRQALETEQQPVAWLKTWPDGSVSVLKTKSYAFADHELEPLYTAPPKQWVGLTYEEIQIVASKKWWDWEDSFDIEGFSRAIERVLKEKNHG